jgi:acyl-CoA synthetase (AMP-forming)/AMP-acid ligase II/aryl carrier-like protein
MSQGAAPRKDILPQFLQNAAVSDRLVHLIPDELASQTPEHVLFSFPKSGNFEDGFVDVTAKNFANAINRTSWYLESTLGKAPEGEFPALAYVGTSKLIYPINDANAMTNKLPDDLRYFLFMFGAIKAGYKMLYLSPRNSVAGHINVLEKANCKTIFLAQSVQFDHVLSDYEMKTIIAPELNTFLETVEVPSYPYSKTFAEARNDPCLVLHTTGSTGLPKPITWKLDILSTYEAWRTIPSIDGYVPTTEIYQEARRVYSAMPLFHTSGINLGITFSLVLGVTTVLGAADVVPHAGYADEMQQHTSIDAIAGPPSTFEDLSLDAASLKRLGGLKYVLACGAPLAQTTGDLLSGHTRVISNFGATETACLPRLAPAIEDWSYFYWHPSHSGIEMREAIDGLFELFLVKKPELRNYQGVFSTFPTISEYSMNDLYSRHPDPSKPFLYRWCSRADDVIVLSNGEKLAPALMEAGLRSNARVQGAMVVGRGKFQPAALVDVGPHPPVKSEDRYNLIEELIPAIEEANRHAPAHGKLDPYLIMFVEPARPMKYLGQGKIQRNQTYAMYEKDFEELYKNAETESMQGGQDTPDVDFADGVGLAVWLAQMIGRIAPGLGQLTVDDVLFAKGMDSLQVIRLVREVRFHADKKGFKQLHEALSPKTVYTNPSIGKLVHFIQKETGYFVGAESDESTESSDYESSDSEDKTVLEKILEKHVQRLPAKTSTLAVPIPPQGKTVVLTGSTGSLGSYLLSQLINDPTVAKIICLDRAADPGSKYEQNRLQRGLSVATSLRVEFYKVNVSLPQLGLDDETYNHIAESATHILHCQWPVNFNWTVQVFEPYITGVGNLINLAHAAPHKPLLMFVSSVAAVGGWKSGIVPEAPIRDLSASAPTGYGQSKLIAECLLDEAARISGVKTTVCRVGIVAGPVTKEEGLWNVHEYIPSVSKHFAWRANICSWN